jgi:glyoxylase-like metal-dependent hydrolase (beta-lactamase superfamily II)
MDNALSRPRLARYQSSTGHRVYRIPMQVFPGFYGYAYLLLGDMPATLIDTGSGFGHSTSDLLKGIEAVQSEYGEAISVKQIERIIISHGHVDHCGGLNDLMTLTSAQVGVHPLDRRILTHYDERRLVANKDLTIFLERAGLNPERQAKMLDLYNWSKQHIKSIPVSFVVEEGDTLDGMEFFHVPGHCSGQVAIRMGDVLISADHVLSHTSPHVAAESITNWTGLAHYRESLHKIRRLEGITLTLGGHEDPIYELHDRIDALQVRIDEKLRWITDMIRQAGEPLTIQEISKRRYPDKHGFDVLLALQEAGAYIEYLYDRGHLGIANLDEVEKQDNPVLLYYVLD